MLLVSAQPLWSGDLRKPGWDAVPHGLVATRPATSPPRTAPARVLVLPGSGFGQQGWGWTIDEPIQGLATTPWAARSQVPLTPGGTIRNLDAIQERISDGQGSPYLADLLARAGIEYVLVRRDLDIFASGAPDPARVDLAVSRSPGLVRAAAFGRTGFGEQPLIDIYRVDRPVTRVRAVALDDVTTLAGGPEDVLTAHGVRRARPREPGGDRRRGELARRTPPTSSRDGYRKRERSFGRLEDALGEVMARDEPYRVVRSAHDYPGVRRRGARLRPLRRRLLGHRVDVGRVRRHARPGATRARSVRRRRRAARDLLAVLTADRPGGSVGRRAVHPAHRRSTASRSQAGVDGFTGMPVRSDPGRGGRPVAFRRRRPVDRAWSRSPWTAVPSTTYG